MDALSDPRGSSGPLAELPGWLSTLGALGTAALSACTVVVIIATSHHHG